MFLAGIEFMFGLIAALVIVYFVLQLKVRTVKWIAAITAVCAFWVLMAALLYAVAH